MNRRLLRVTMLVGIFGVMLTPTLPALADGDCALKRTLIRSTVPATTTILERQEPSAFIERTIETPAAVRVVEEPVLFERTVAQPMFVEKVIQRPVIHRVIENRVTRPLMLHRIATDDLDALELDDVEIKTKDGAVILEIDD